MTNDYFYFSKDLFIEIATFLMLILGVAFVEKSLIAISTFMIIYSDRYNITSLARNFGNFSDMFITIKTSSKRMFSFFNDDLFEVEKFGDISLEDVIGNIEFKNVAFAYKDYKIEENEKDGKQFKKLVSQKEVFSDLNFKIPHNKTVAFVGKSGSGKSTILNLISKIYEVDKGEVLIDGNDIKSLNKETIRKTFSLVNQFPYIFDMTIKENLLMANKEASDKEIDEVVKQAYLYEFISTLNEEFKKMFLAENDDF